MVNCRRLVAGLAVAAGLAAALVVAEAATRVLARVNGTCHPECITRYHPVLGWTNAPGTSGPHRHAELGVDVIYRIDARGAREIGNGGRDDRAFRMVVLGDSNAFGWGVADDRHFAALLSHRTGAEVLNLAVSGYGTDQAMLRFVTEGVPFRPQVVVVQLTPNDLEDIQLSFVGGRPKPRFVLAHGGLRIIGVPTGVAPHDARSSARQPWWSVPVWNFLRRYSYLCAWIDERLRHTGTPPPRPDRFSVEAIALLRALVERIHTEAAAQGAVVVLVHASEEMRRHADNAFPPGVDVLDLADGFNAEQPALFADGLHWNRRGHQLAAERLAHWMAERGLALEQPQGPSTSR